MRTMAALLMMGCTASIEVPEGAIVLVGGTVLTMLDESAEVASVVVVDDRIVDVIPGTPTFAEEVERIDIAGTFVMPGLADMHVHNWYEDQHVLFVANGVTTVRNLFGDDLHLEWRRKIARGRRFGPTLYTSGPIVDGSPPWWPGSDVAATEAMGRAAVNAQADDGYDAIKVYSQLPAEAWRAILDEAAILGIPVMGHAPSSVSYRDVIASNQRTIEHLDGFLEGAAGSPRLDHTSAEELLTLLDTVDTDGIRALAQETAATGTWNCPTTTVYRHILSPTDAAAKLDDPRMRYVHPQLLTTWATGVDATYAAAQAARIDTHLAIIGALHEAGAPLLLGTDTTNAFVVSGFSVHEELQSMVDAGLSPYEALRTSTIEAGRAMEEDFGTIAIGQRADLLVLNANPFDDVGHASDRVGVMVRGQWHAEDELQERLEAVAVSYGR